MDSKSVNNIRDNKEILSQKIKKRVETTMIGSLSTIEKYFDFLWKNNSEFSEDQRNIMLDIYNRARSEILDKGNLQLRNVDIDLSDYDINRKKYSYHIPINKIT